MESQPLILIVEDDPVVAYTIADVLDEADYRSISVATIAAALHSVDHDSPDLIVLDRNLPDGRGDQLCQQIKAHYRPVLLPILMLTGQASVADRVEGLYAGADDYLTKPFDVDELLARVRALLRIRSADMGRVQALDKLQQQHEALRATYEQLRTAQAQLVSTSKLAALGSLVAGVTHELNNPLAIILGNAELLQAFPDESTSLSRIIDATHRARQVVQSLATFAGQSPDQKDWYEPLDLVKRVVDVRRVWLEHASIMLEVVHADHAPMIVVNRQQMQHALLNLLLNAERALDGCSNARIVISVTCEASPGAPPILPERPQQHPCEDGVAKQLVIDIMDNGIGIANTVRDHLFEPFITTHPVGEGVGLGLSTAYGIVTQHGGTLQASSVLGCGTTFRITLPVATFP